MRKFGALLFALFVNSVRGQLSQDPVATRAPKRLSATAVENLARMNDLQQFTQLLAPLMVRRVPATPPHAEVRRFIIDRLEKSGFNVWTHDFEARVPFIDNIISGQKLPFSNIVATFHPNAPRKLVFACHYDSKYFHPNSRFIGAIDSAVPCAMLLDMARTLGPHLAQLQSPEVTLQLVFFDGEEAFGQWSSTDSLYGSRALAQFWETTGELGSIDMLVLLDLLGGELGSCRSGLFRSCPELSSYMRSTQGFFDRMVQIEDILHRKKLLAAHQGVRRYLQTEPKYHVGIEDDHVPFMKRGVRIVHAITAPFPQTWHQESDDADSLHWPTIQNLNTIFRAAAAEYLGLGSI